MGQGFFTILFTDLVGSSSLFDSRGDEAANALRREHFAALRRVVAEHGGNVVKSTGDGLMVAFPSAVAAVRCAVQMQRATTGSESGLQMRIGLDAGEPLREDDDLYGTPVIVASRLCDRAGAGEILASEVVSRIAGPRAGAAIEPVAPLSLKGITGPIPAARVRWADWKPADEPRARRPVRAGPAGEVPLEREVEVEALEALIDATAAGAGRLLLIEGPAGIGKTLLMQELRRRAAVAGVQVLGARGGELERDFGFGIVRQLMEPAIAAANAATTCSPAPPGLPSRCSRRHRSRATRTPPTPSFTGSTGSRSTLRSVPPSCSRSTMCSGATARPYGFSSIWRGGSTACPSRSSSPAAPAIPPATTSCSGP